MMQVTNETFPQQEQNPKYLDFQTQTLTNSLCFHGFKKNNSTSAAIAQPILFKSLLLSW